jgi:hypothetical protein
MTKSLLAVVPVALALALGATASAKTGTVPSFAPAKRYGVPPVDACGRCAHSTAIGDIDGDGRPDVVTVNDDETISIFIAKPDGSLGSRRDYLASGDPAGAAIADLNGDGHADVAVADRGGFVTVFLNRADGTLAPKQDYAAGSFPESIAAGDLDGDGSPDLVVTSSDSVSVLRNNGDGTFAAKEDYPVGGGTTVALGDLNGDGKLDVVTGDTDPHTNLSVLLNAGDGTLQIARDYDALGAVSVALGDLNGDGKLDVATANDRGVSVLLDAGDGTLQRRRVYDVLGTYDSAGDPQSIAIADLNGDRRADLVTANSDRHLSLLLNNGAGGFHTTIDVGTGRCGEVYRSDRWLATGDLNGDGRADLAVRSLGRALRGPRKAGAVQRPGRGGTQGDRGENASRSRPLPRRRNPPRSLAALPPRPRERAAARVRTGAACGGEGRPRRQSRAALTSAPDGVAEDELRRAHARRADHSHDGDVSFGGRDACPLALDVRDELLLVVTAVQRRDARRLRRRRVDGREEGFGAGVQGGRRLRAEHHVCVGRLANQSALEVGGAAADE